MRSFAKAYLLIHTSFFILFPSLVRAFEGIELDEEIALPISIRAPKDLAVDFSGKIFYVLDGKRNAIWQYNVQSKQWQEAVRQSGEIDHLAISAGGLLAYSGEKELFVLGKAANKPIAKLPLINGIAWDSLDRILSLGDQLTLIDPQGGVQYAFGKFEDFAGISTIWPSDTLALIHKDRQKINLFNPRGVGLQEIALPSGAKLQAFCTDPYGWTYVATKDQTILELTPESTLESSFGRKGSGFGEFADIRSIARDSLGRLWILDAKNKRVSKFQIKREAKGLPLSVFPEASWSFVPYNRRGLPDHVNKIVAPLSGNQIWIAVGGKDPSIITQDSRGNLSNLGRIKDENGAMIKLASLDSIETNADASELYALEDKKSRILRLDAKELKTLNSIGGKKSALRNPIDLLLQGNRLFILEEDKIHIYTPKGIFLNTVGPAISTNDQDKPVTFKNLTRVRARPDTGLIYVLDSALGRIFVFSSEAKLLNVIGVDPDKKSNPDHFGVLQEAQDMAIDPYGNVYVLTPHAVEVFELKGQNYAFAFRWALPETNFNFANTCVWTSQAEGKNYLAIGDTREKSLSLIEVRYRPAVEPGALTIKDTGGAAQILNTAYDAAKPITTRILRSTSPAINSDLKFIGEIKDQPVIDADFGNIATTYYYFIETKSLWSNQTTLPVRLPKSYFPEAARIGVFTISSFSVTTIFSSNYKSFADEPVGWALLANTSHDKTFQNVKVSFLIKEFMDFPTEKVYDVWPPGESKKVPLYAVFNNKILSISEDTPIQTELAVTFFENSKEQRIALTQSATMLNRNAIGWKNLAQLGNFVTPKDPPVLNTLRGNLHLLENALQEKKALQEILDPVTLNLWKTWQVYSSLNLRYAPDPNNPYDKVDQSQDAIDYLEFPRETLARKSGDCDDLSATLATLAEIEGLETAFLDIPGHIFVAINTQIPKTEQEFNLDAPKDWYMEYQDTLWIPLEVTMIGSSFEDAWKEAAQTYKKAAQDKSLRVLLTRQAWEHFKPATLPEPIDKTSSVQEATAESQKQWPVNLGQSLDKLRQSLEETSTKSGDSNFALGAIALRYKDNAKAQSYWSEAYRANPKDLRVLNNLANIYLLEQNYAMAEKLYKEALAVDAKDEDLSVNWEVYNEIKNSQKPTP